MAYFDPNGSECTYSDAYAGGRLRPGYRSTVGNGEHLAFDLNHFDAAAGSIFLTDSRGDRADSGLANANSIRLMTGRSPVSADPKVQAVADQVARDHAAKQRLNDAYVTTLVVDHSRSSVPLQDQAKLEAGAAVRDAARAAQYR